MKQLVATDAFGKGSPTRKEMKKAMDFERGVVIDLVSLSGAQQERESTSEGSNEEKKNRE